MDRDDRSRARRERSSDRVRADVPRGTLDVGEARRGAEVDAAVGAGGERHPAGDELVAWSQPGGERGTMKRRVPEENATAYGASTIDANACSNSATCGPWVSQSCRSASATAAMSSSSIVWRPYGIAIARRLVGAHGTEASVSIMRAVPSPELQEKVVLVTGGTGSFGSEFVRTLLDEHEPASVRVYSRDELKQYELAQRFDDSRLRSFIGDVRDGERLKMAARGVDVIVHAAALKQVPACEYNPFEAVQTNALSTDKAVNPVNLYGATKLCAEKIVTQGNAYSGDVNSRFASVRYGNVIGSRGSVIPLFLRQAEEGQLTVTDEAMTRFWITLRQAVDFVIACLSWMEGGEVFIPKIPSTGLVDIIEAIAPDVPRRTIGVRSGEKAHEVLITEDESRHATEFDDHFVIYPAFPFWRMSDYMRGDELPPGFRYASDSNSDSLSAEQIRELAGLVAAD